MMLLCLLTAAAAVAVPEWENPEVNAINRLPSRTYSMPLASERDALADALEPETPYRKSLNLVGTDPACYESLAGTIAIFGII